MDDETRAELTEQAAEYRLIDEMVKTKGWQALVIPRFEQIKERAMATLLRAAELNEFFRAQQTILAVDEVLSTLMLKMKDGEEAAKQLAKDKEE